MFDVIPSSIPPDDRDGGERFFAVTNFGATFNYQEASIICKQNNATLPRRLTVDTTNLNSLYMALAVSRGQSLNFWVKECESSGNCYSWEINSFSGSSTKELLVAPTMRNGYFYVICERGKSSATNPFTCTSLRDQDFIKTLSLENFIERHSSDYTRSSYSNSKSM